MEKQAPNLVLLRKCMYVCGFAPSLLHVQFSCLLYCRPTMKTECVGWRRQSAPADWAKESTAKIVHRLTTGAAGDVIQMVFQNRLAYNKFFQTYKEL